MPKGQSFWDKQAIDKFNMEIPLGGEHPTDIVLHVGTNNIDKNNADQILQMMIELVESAQSKFPEAIIHLSEILPRKSPEMNKIAIETNIKIRNHRWQPNVKLISHQKITTEHLRDERHLAYRYDENDRQRMSGSMWLAASIFQSILSFKVSYQSLLYARLRKSDIYPSY